MKRLIALGACLFFLQSTQVMAQDKAQGVVKDLKRVISMIQQGKLKQAVSDLKFAIAELQEVMMAKAVEKMKKIFSPWVGKAQQSNQAGLAFLGGGMNIKIDYHNTQNQEEVGFECVANSPLIQTFTMWLSNPMFLGQGRSLVKLGDSREMKAVYSESDGTLQLVHNNNLYTWTARGVQNIKETLLKFGNYFANHQAPALSEAFGE
ncbi:MAG: hypothetical protein ACE5IR_19245 [bacterium]